MELSFEGWVTFHLKVDIFEGYIVVKVILSCCLKILSHLKKSASLWNNLFIHDSQS